MKTAADIAKEFAKSPRMPDGGLFLECVKNTKHCRLTSKGLRIKVRRRQYSDQDGKLSIRSCLFYQPIGCLDPCGYIGDISYGGPVCYTGTILLKRPLFAQGDQGGYAIGRVFKEVFGDDEYRDLRNAVGRVADYKRMDTDVYVRNDSLYRSEILDLFNRFGGDVRCIDGILEFMDVCDKQVKAAIAAGRIINVHENHQDVGSKLWYTLMENVYASRLRAEGFDSVLGWYDYVQNHRCGESGGVPPFFTEVVDLEALTYPGSGTAGFRRRCQVSRG